MKNNILLKNALICDEVEDYVSDILIKDGVIVQISKDCHINFDTQIIDIKERYVLPGLIDLNCEVCEPGYDFMEDLKTVSHSAAKSGFTSLTANPNTYPVIDNDIIVKHLKTLAKDKSIVNIFPYGHMTKDGENTELSEIGEMYRSGIVAISDGNNSVQDSFILKSILTYAKMFEIPVITVCENKLLSNEGLINQGYASALTGLRGVPASAEEVYVARNMLLAKEENCKIHITKVSTQTSVDLIRFAKSTGVNITCDTCPQYIIFDEESVLEYNPYFKINPPLRTKKDNYAIIEGLMDGTIDCISTGHKPEHEESKRREFESASFGFSGLEPAFLVCYNNLVLESHLTLFELVQKLSKNAYDILKIKDKGLVKVGQDADLFIFDPNSETFLDEKELETKAKYSVFHNTTFKGSIDMTIVGGDIVYSK